MTINAEAAEIAEIFLGLRVTKTRRRGKRVDGRRNVTRETGLERMHERHAIIHSFVHPFDPASAVGPLRGPTLEFLHIESWDREG